MASVPPLRLLRNAEGVWLHLTAPSGKEATVNLSLSKNSILRAVLDELVPPDDSIANYPSDPPA